MSDASARGWGPGWPNCQGAKIVKVNFGGVTYPAGVRAELAELVGLLTEETARRGYLFGVPGDPDYGNWGYNCRPIGDGNNPSNHSWGLAVDINAPRNPQTKPLTTDMPGWMPERWKAYGFGWGGEYSGTPDAMHYEYLGTPGSCEQDTARARTGFGAPPPPTHPSAFPVLAFP